MLHFPRESPHMSASRPESALRPWLLAAALAGATLTLTVAVRAASGPESDTSTPASNVPTAGASYTAAIKLTGPTTQFHDSVVARYNYAFGKDSPFLPSNAMTVNGQFLSPK